MQNPFIKITEIKCGKVTEAQNSLWEGLILLMREKPVYEIGVKQLCQVAHVARSTFYVYYQNVDELLEEIENYHIIKLLGLNHDIMVNKCYDENSVAFYEETMLYLEEYKKTFYCFLVAYPNVRFIEKWKEAIKYHVWERGFGRNEIKNNKLLLEMAASEIMAAYTFWLQHPYEVDISGVNRIIVNTIRAWDYKTEKIQQIF
ncbi:transcriptional regulator, TetR family [Anaerocolumna jejuensis DSM 15929]|uniref:Transcriptional regulator, TetR family n=1 Tax=Anaerocolumna jejuensis DSM 15929 TaxID=1121322 RepID=A0A1M6NWT5_9FIRM|nr:TetR/AcrR family transcriptional regulator [Anaerocolumna jejuensis]SHK00094.1 transcriptional regulator, TetR family [Anaerocolumna jejuensis DSM 15929]